MSNYPDRRPSAGRVVLTVVEVGAIIGGGILGYRAYQNQNNVNTAVLNQLATLNAPGLPASTLQPRLGDNLPAGTSELIQGTPTPGELPPAQCDLFNFYAQDIVSSIPNLNAKQVSSDLQTIASKIPKDVPFDVTGCKGIIPNPATGQVIEEKGPVNWNAPEGGYGYISTGNINIGFNGNRVNLPYIPNNVHLAFIMGNTNNHNSTDLNTTLELSNFPAGHTYANLAFPQQNSNYENRDVIDQAWFSQQLWWASQSGSNCGVGCENTITVSFIDVETGRIRIFEVNPSTFDWKETNYDQMNSRSGQSSTDQLKRLSGGNLSRITGAVNPRANRNLFKGGARV